MTTSHVHAAAVPPGQEVRGISGRRQHRFPLRLHDRTWRTRRLRVDGPRGCAKPRLSLSRPAAVPRRRLRASLHKGSVSLLSARPARLSTAPFTADGLHASPNRCAVNAAPGQLSRVQQVVGDFLAGLGQRTAERKPACPHAGEVRPWGPGLCRVLGPHCPAGGAHTCRPTPGLRPCCRWHPRCAVT